MWIIHWLEYPFKWHPPLLNQLCISTANPMYKLLAYNGVCVMSLLGCKIPIVSFYCVYQPSVLQWGTYRTNHPGGAIMQVSSHVVKCQCCITWLRHIHSLYPPFVIIRCIYNHWCLKELKRWTKKEISSAYVKNTITSLELSCVLAPSSNQSCRFSIHIYQEQLA